jgi:hypothetical protein
VPILIQNQKAQKKHLSSDYFSYLGLLNEGINQIMRLFPGLNHPNSFPFTAKPNIFKGSLIILLHV